MPEPTLQDVMTKLQELEAKLNQPWDISQLWSLQHLWSASAWMVSLWSFFLLLYLVFR